MSRPLHPTQPAKDAADQAKLIVKPFGSDEQLLDWTSRLITAADDFVKNKRRDPLDSFI